MSIAKDGVGRRCNGGDRGNVEQRRRRREWLVQNYRADVDVLHVTWPDGQVDVGMFGTSRPEDFAGVAEAHLVPACRCYRCGELLTVDTVTVDRIIPGIKGGTYRRDNIRPACSSCNTETGLALRWPS